MPARIGAWIMQAGRFFCVLGMDRLWEWWRSRDSRPEDKFLREDVHRRTIPFGTRRDSAKRIKVSRGGDAG